MSCQGQDILCGTCRKLDFKDLLQNPRLANYSWETTEPSPHTMRHSEECKLCLLMFQGVPAQDMDKTFELRSFSFKKMSYNYWAKETHPNGGDSVLLKSGLQKRAGFYAYPPEDVFCQPSNDDPPDLYCAQPVQEVWDCSKARSWIDTCVNHHGPVCQHEVFEVSGMNLIDCEGMVIVKWTQEMRWIALSYFGACTY
jgi:hypothetical protein